MKCSCEGFNTCDECVDFVEHHLDEQKWGETKVWPDGKVHTEVYDRTTGWTCECLRFCGGGPNKWVVRPKKKVNSKVTAYWYSVRPKFDSDIDLRSQEDQFMNRIKKFLNSTSIQNFAIQYEWKWDGDAPYGMHAHMLLQGDNMGAIKQHIVRQKELMFRLDLNRQLIALTNDDMIQDKLLYMMGHIYNNDDKYKEEEKFKDIRERQKRAKEKGLEALCIAPYTSGPIFQKMLCYPVLSDCIVKLQSDLEKLETAPLVVKFE